MKNILIALLVIGFIVLAVLVAWYFMFGKKRDVDETSALATTTVSIENGRFVPETIKINAGDTVTWTNNDTTSHIVASDPHPIHTDLSGLESEALSPGESYSFTFDEVGEHTYHCHIHPTTMKGAVIVE